MNLKNVTVKPKEYNLATERITLGVMEWGNPEGLPVLAIHGWLDNAESFSVLAESMDLSHIRLICIDLPGHGVSEHRKAGEIYHLLDYVVDIVGVIKALRYDKVLLLGHSLGGIIAMLTAAAVPTKVTKLVMLDSLGPMVDAEADVSNQLIKAISKICFSQSRSPNLYASISEAVDARVGGFSKLKPAAAKRLVERGICKRENGFYWTTDSRLKEPSLMRLSEKQVEGFMASISCPSLLIAAENGYISLDSDVNTRLAYMADLAVHKVEGGHHFHMDGDVKKTAELISDFIRREVEGHLD